MAEKRNIPQLRFPEFFNNWSESHGDSIFETISDKNHNSDLPILAITQDHGAIPRELIDFKISVSDKSIDSYKVVQIGDFIISLRSFQGGIEYSDYKGICSPAYIVLRPYVEVDKSFFKIYFKTDRYIKLLQRNLEGIRDGKMISFKYFSEIELFVPSIPEQEKIADFLSAVDDKLQALKKKNELLEQYKKGVMQKIFSREIRFRDESGKDFPKWEEKMLVEVLYEHGDRNKNNTISEVFSVAKHKGVINQIEHLGRSFSAKDVSNYKIIYPHDIVYTKSPTSSFPFGIIKQNLTDRTGLVSPLYGVFRPETKALGFMLYNYFLSWVNTYNYLNPLVEKGAKNTMNINNNTFLNGARIYFPVSEKEQNKIADFLLTFDNKINHCQKIIDQAKKWKKGLLQKMFV